MQNYKTLGTSWRENDLASAEKVARRAFEFAGISRVFRVDGLAGTKIPVYSVARPLSKVAVTISAGKGTTPEESRLSAIFEAIESAASEKEIPSRLMSREMLIAQNVPHVPFEKLCTEEVSHPILWGEVRDWESGEIVLCPTVAINMLEAEAGPFLPISNGLASGTTLDEAIFHGLTEVLERHAHSWALVRREGTSVRMEDLSDPFLMTTMSEISAQGLKLEIKDISSPIGIPCYYALLFSPGERDSHLIAGGMGCHLDPLIAFRRAIAEAFQSRAVIIAGAREDITEQKRRQGAEFDGAAELFKFWREPTEEKVAVIPTEEGRGPTTLREATLEVLRQSRKADPSLGRLFTYEFESPKGISVVRVILEGAEIFTLDRSRLGPSLKKYFVDAGVDLS